MSNFKNDSAPNKLSYKGNLYRRAHSSSQEAVMWKEFGHMVKRLSDISNSDDIPTFEKYSSSKKLWEELRFYADQLGISKP